MLWRACVNFLKALYILRKSQPDLVVSTGECPFYWPANYLASKQYSLRGSPAQGLEPEWKTRVQPVDEFYVQWPECKKRYPKAQRCVVA